MFLEALRRRNPFLIEQAIALHQGGSLPANAYVIDLDTVEENARTIANAAEKLGLTTLAMTKQMGRNGSFCRAVKRGGITKAVAVDMECARGRFHLQAFRMLCRFRPRRAAAQNQQRRTDCHMRLPALRLPS